MLNTLTLSLTLTLTLNLSLTLKLTLTLYKNKDQAASEHELKSLPEQVRQSCLVFPLSCLVVSCRVLSCLVLPCHALPMPCLVISLSLFNCQGSRRRCSCRSVQRRGGFVDRQGLCLFPNANLKS
jgi:hypothetical protein